VRLQAVLSLARWGPDASAAASDLAELLNDPEAQVAHYADVALWQVNYPTALRAGSWREVRSEEWDFSACFPAAPEKTTHVLNFPFGKATTHSFQASHGVTRCMVKVCDHPQISSDEERLAHMRASVVLFFGELAALSEDKAIAQDGREGREFLVEVK